MAIQKILSEPLTFAGYKVTTASDGLEGINYFHEQDFDLILLDILLPKIDGYTVCEMIRQESQIPIIILTALDSEDAQIKGFDKLADDYITKPFGMMELVARIKALLRRAETGSEDKDVSKETIYEMGSLSVYPERHKVKVCGSSVNLTLKEYELLLLLLQNKGMVFTRDQLLNKIWGYEFDGESRTVDVHIRRLREKIESNPSEPRYVHTKWGVGYYFNNK